MRSLAVQLSVGDSVTGRSREANPGLPREHCLLSPKSVFAATLETERPCRTRANRMARGRHGVRTAERAGDATCVFPSRPAAPLRGPAPLPAGHAAGPALAFKPRRGREALTRDPRTPVSSLPGVKCPPSARLISRLPLAVDGGYVVTGSGRDEGRFRDRAAVCLRSCSGKSSWCHASHRAPQPPGTAATGVKRVSALCWAAFHKVHVFLRSGSRGRRTPLRPALRKVREGSGRIFIHGFLKHTETA